MAGRARGVRLSPKVIGIRAGGAVLAALAVLAVLAVAPYVRALGLPFISDDYLQSLARPALRAGGRVAGPCRRRALPLPRHLHRDHVLDRSASSGVSAAGLQRSPAWCCTFSTRGWCSRSASGGRSGGASRPWRRPSSPSMRATRRPSSGTRRLPELLVFFFSLAWRFSCGCSGSATAGGVGPPARSRLTCSRCFRRNPAWRWSRCCCCRCGPSESPCAAGWRRGWASPPWRRLYAAMIFAGQSNHLHLPRRHVFLQRAGGAGADQQHGAHAVVLGRGGAGGRGGMARPALAAPAGAGASPGR